MGFIFNAIVAVVVGGVPLTGGFGWTDPKIAMHYVAMADRKRLALDAQRAIAWD
jgi:hypothetical protein